MKVLVVDDSRIALRVTQMFLEAIGHEAICVTSPTEFITQMTQVEPDALLIDLDMPTIRGDKLAKIVRETRPSGDLRIVLHSSKPVEEIRSIAAACGADGVMQKTSNGGTFYSEFNAAVGVAIAPEKAMPSMKGGLVKHTLPAPMRLGVNWMDTHHQMLFSSYRQYVEERDTNGSARTEVFLGFLERYASFHFSTEERLMLNDSPASDRHRAEHRQFLTRIASIRQDLQLPHRFALAEKTLTDYIGNWIVRHINETDRAMVNAS